MFWKLVLGQSLVLIFNLLGFYFDQVIKKICYFSFAFFSFSHIFLFYWKLPKFYGFYFNSNFTVDKNFRYFFNYFQRLWNNICNSWGYPFQKAVLSFFANFICFSDFICLYFVIFFIFTHNQIVKFDCLPIYFLT